jgi:2-desacetyl-2-hydroxyethyl bacteriochlorophyllide A dehydrogenase
MKALVFDKTLALADVAVPVRQNGDVRIRITKAGICATDHEIVKGYMAGFKGVLGHEFLGIVDEADDPALAGRRVSAEINFACGTCEYCSRGLARHCPHRSVLGIQNRDGACAEYVTAPVENVFEIPPSIPDSTAVFIEPLAAALAITEQVPVEKKSVLLIGDGKLGLLIARVLQKSACDCLVAGNHAENLSLLSVLGIKTVLSQDLAEEKFDVVIEASGNPAAFARALGHVKPRGTMVLKSTYASTLSFNPSPLVVDEISLIGSRCGRFGDAIRFMQEYSPDFSALISREFPFDKAIEAFEYSKQPGVLKVVLNISPP